MTQQRTSSLRSAPKFLDDDTAINAYTLALHSDLKKEKTITTYLYSLSAFRKFCAERGMPPLVEVTAEHVREFLADLYKRGRKPAGISVRYRSLAHFYRWMQREGERPDYPLATVPAPRIPDVIQPHYKDHEIQKVLASLPPVSKDPLQLRDRAIVLVLLDSGLRGAELCGLKSDDLDYRDLSLVVHQPKGGRERRVGISPLTASTIERYHRRRQPSKWLFAARDDGPLTFNALRNMLRRLFTAAGVEFKGVHGFRRSFAIGFLDAGGDPSDLQTLAGWASPQMLRRYTAATSTQRALKAHRRYSPVQNLGLTR
jgi:site-specific recombinase XerD